MDTMDSNLLQDDFVDNSGLTEIQQGIAAIERMKSGEPQEPAQEIEELEEEAESQEAEAAEEENAIETEEKAPEEKFVKPESDWKKRKRRFQQIKEKQDLLQENERLKQMLNESLNSGTYHYGKSAEFELERAKQKKRVAIEEGDVDALIEADIDLTKALNTVNEIEKWSRSEQAPRTTGENSGSYPAIQESNEVMQELANDWLESHPYLQPTSKHYNQNVATEVAKFINDLDANLAKNNQMNSYFSDEYFDVIDNHIEKLRHAPRKATKIEAPLNHIGGVRNAYSSNVGGGKAKPTLMTLTKDEKIMAANMGVSEKEWLKYKITDSKNGR